MICSTRITQVVKERCQALNLPINNNNKVFLFMSHDQNVSILCKGNFLSAQQGYTVCHRQNKYHRINSTSNRISNICPTFSSCISSFFIYHVFISILATAHSPWNPIKMPLDHPILWWPKKLVELTIDLSWWIFVVQSHGCHLKSANRKFGIEWKVICIKQDEWWKVSFTWVWLIDWCHTFGFSLTNCNCNLFTARRFADRNSEKN